MARDDYYVIVYQILSYLYVQLKSGNSVNPKLITHDSEYLKINESYWLYIIENLLKDGYIENIALIKTWGNQVIVDNLDQCRITPRGIAYLCENSFIEKAKQFLKDTKAIVPFI